MKKYRLTAECHIITYPDQNQQLFIAYFPLQSLMLKINQSGIDLIEELKKKPIYSNGPPEEQFLDHLENIGVVNSQPENIPKHSYPPEPRPVRTMLLTSEKCNLRCLYCYGKSGDKGEFMPFEIAKAAVDLLIENSKRNKISFIDLGFHGGGEPTLNWDVLKTVVEYAEKKCIEHKLHLRSTICTNGLISEDQAAWLVKHIKSITVSIDGPPEIQNLQRPLANGKPSFDYVSRTIDFFTALKKPFVFRTTATAYTQGKLAKIYTYLADRFHPSAICIEPVFVCGRCETSQCKPPELESFINDIHEILTITSVKKISLQYSGGRIFYIDSVFCGASGKNFFITPSGDVTSCVEVASREDSRAGIFIYGKYDRIKGIFQFDIEKYRKLCGLQVQEFDSCKACFARWHCSGDCLAKAPDITKLKSDRNSYRCMANKAVTRLQLLAEMNPSIINSSSAKESDILKIKKMNQETVYEK